MLNDNWEKAITIKTEIGNKLRKEAHILPVGYKDLLSS